MVFRTEESGVNPVSEKSSMHLSHTDTVESTVASRATHLDRWLIVVIAVCAVVWPGPANALTILDVDSSGDAATQLISNQSVDYTADDAETKVGDLASLSSSHTAPITLEDAETDVATVDATLSPSTAKRPASP